MPTLEGEWLDELLLGVPKPKYASLYTFLFQKIDMSKVKTFADFASAADKLIDEEIKRLKDLGIKIDKPTYLRRFRGLYEFTHDPKYWEQYMEPALEDAVSSFVETLEETISSPRSVREVEEALESAKGTLLPPSMEKTYGKRIRRIIGTAKDIIYSVDKVSELKERLKKAKTLAEIDKVLSEARSLKIPKTLPEHGELESVIREAERERRTRARELRRVLRRALKPRVPKRRIRL